MHSASANPSATPKGGDVRTPIAVEEEEEEAEVGLAMEISMPMKEQMGKAAASPPTATPDNTYLAIVSVPTPITILTTAISVQPSPAPIYSIVVTNSPIPTSLLPICDAITDTLRYALGQGAHPTLLTQETTVVQSKMSG